MKRLLLLLSLVGSQYAFAGATQVYVECTSKNVSVTTSFPGDFLGARISVNAPNLNLTFWDDNAVQDAKMNNQTVPAGARIVPITGIDALDKGILTVAVLESGIQTVTLVSEPSSVKVKKTTNGQTAVFKAQLKAYDQNDTNKSVDTQVACTYTYEI